MKLEGSILTIRARSKDMTSYVIQKDNETLLDYEGYNLGLCNSEDCDGDTVEIKIDLSTGKIVNFDLQALEDHIKELELVD